MDTIQRSALVGYSAEQMYRLVDDVERYPEFVPYCKNASVDSRSENQVTATLEIAKSGIAKSFSTCNQLEPFSNIKIQLVDGPFRHLSGEWRFIALAPEACKIEMQLDFEFSNKLASLAFSRVFNQLMLSMVSAFTDRAKTIYG